MATRRFCDRCGAETKEPNIVLHFGFAPELLVDGCGVCSKLFMDIAIKFWKGEAVEVMANAHYQKRKSKLSPVE